MTTQVLNRVLESRREVVDGAVQDLMSFIRTMPCARKHLDEVELALSEALANAVIHGNREDPSKGVRVAAWCDRGEHLVIAVTDEGAGFDPERLPNPTEGDRIYGDGGRGIFLIRRLMDETEYRMGGRQVLMRKRVIAPPEKG